MIGEYTVKIGDKLFDYTNANDIPKKFDHLIKFVPKEPPEHTLRKITITLTLFLKSLKKYLRGNKNNACCD